MALPKIVSLFSGAGGLDLGYTSAGFKLAFAVDHCQWAIRTHQRNFPGTSSLVADLVELQPKGILDHLSGILRPGEPIGVIGGPPCQGFSRANTTSAMVYDPRNDLPLLYLDAVKALQARYNVQFVLFENVLGIRDMKHADNFALILDRFKEIGLHAHVEAHSALDYGVAQTRNRVIISAFRNKRCSTSFVPRKAPRDDLTVRSVIGGLPEPTFYHRSLTPDDIAWHPNHWTMRPLSWRFSVPEYIEVGSRSFRRLDWNRPSPTVAYGHREIHIHPSGRRRLSIFEAMLLQGFPETFVLEGPFSAQVEQVSNAVPPPLATALAKATRRALRTKPTKRAPRGP